ncbi:MAG: nicotinate phosphoribosyltransferase, partial [Bacilli bacterium]
MIQKNYTMMCDFYELTMANGYFESGVADQICYFDVFFRTIPDGGGFAICAGLKQIIEYVQQLTFTSEDIAFLQKKGIFSEAFLKYLKNFSFHGDIYAIPEGTPIFPNEPIMTIRAKAIEAQFMETYIL